MDNSNIFRAINNAQEALATLEHALKNESNSSFPDPEKVEDELVRLGRVMLDTVDVSIGILEKQRAVPPCEKPQMIRMNNK